ncbi:uncharacterized protein JCM15063_003211 [Sporobolomyces koalae]|uniref:uncharacterized protein n=1 Tax=Sporobolomyces koalae TaxID=500713 RepID=UPI00317ECF8C
MASLHPTNSDSLHVLPRPPAPPFAGGGSVPVPPVSTPNAVDEVTVDNLLREANDCSKTVSTISTQLFTLEALRNEVIGLGLACPFSKLEALAGLTTLTGRLILSLSTPLATITNRFETLSTLVERKQVAALPSELGRIREQVETLKLEVKQNVDKVRKAAMEEFDARDSTRRRLEDRVRAENGGISQDQIERTCQGAMNGVGMRVDLIELNSYSGRVCVENPFTALVQLIDDAANEHRKQRESEALSRQATRTSLATTLVGSTSDYGKLELGEDGDGQERQPLSGDLAAREAGTNASEKLSLWHKLRLRWRDYLVRIFLCLVTLGIIVGVTVFESLHQSDEAEEVEASMSSRWDPAATPEARVL